MAKLTPINGHQRDLLQRIGDPPDGWTLSGRDATTVYALRSRKLVTTRSANAYWTATITDRGRAVLDPSDLPGPAPDPPKEKKLPAAPPPLVISGEQLIEQVTAAGGEFRLTDPDPEVRHHWRQALFVAGVAGLVPAGHRLRHRGRDHGDLVIWFEPADPTDEPELEIPAVPVPERVTRYHPVLAATPKAVGNRSSGQVDTMGTVDVAHMRVSGAAFGRATRLLQALIDALLARGHEIGVSDSYGCNGGLTVSISGHLFELVVVEESRREPHVATVKEIAAHERNSWIRIPEWDYLPSGRLQIRTGHSSAGGTLAADRQRWTLDQRLGRVVVELERQGAEAEDRRLEAERAEQRRHEEWKKSMRRAKRRLQEHHRGEVLEDEIRRWRQARAIAEYIDAVKADRGGQLNGSELEWVEWATEYAESINPLRHALAVPAAVKADPDALRPFLGGVSPYEPHEQRRTPPRRLH